MQGWLFFCFGSLSSERVLYSWCLFPFSLSESDLKVDEFQLVADNDDEEEAAAEPPCKFALVAFLATLGEAPGVAGMDLSKSSCTLMTSKLSWLSVLVDFLMEVPPELLDRGSGLGLVSVTCVAGKEMIRPPVWLS